MNFYEMSVSMAFSRDKLLEIANRAFGGCKPDYPRYVDCKFSNREVNISYWPEEKAVSVIFSFVSAPEHLAADTFPTGRELQGGTIEGIRKFQAFATELKKYGIGIKYTTEGHRREDLYSKVLKKAGMSAVTTGDQGWIWR